MACTWLLQVGLVTSVVLGMHRVKANIYVSFTRTTNQSTTPTAPRNGIKLCTSMCTSIFIPIAKPFARLRGSYNAKYYQMTTTNKK
eukprot:3452182-Amphidinium_carterae.1